MTTETLQEANQLNAQIHNFKEHIRRITAVTQEVAEAENGAPFFNLCGTETLVPEFMRHAGHNVRTIVVDYLVTIECRIRQLEAELAAL